MCVVICVTNPVAEEAQPGAETVNPATPAAKEKKDDNGGESDTTQVMVTQTNEEVPNASVEKIAKDAVEPEAGFEWYVPVKEDEDRFTHELTRLASTAAAHLIMLAI